MSSSAGHDSLAAAVVERVAGLLVARWAFGHRAERQVKDASPLEVARSAHAPLGEHRLDLGLGEARLSEDLADLRLLPDVETPLLSLRVRVERRVEAALRPAHLPQGPVEDPLADLAPALVAQGLEPVEVRPGEQRVVVEHLLEVRDQPGAVDRVAGEAAPDLVVDAAVRHPVEGELGDVGIAPCEKQLERRSRRELRGAAEAAATHVRGHPKARDRRVEQRRRRLIGHRLDLGYRPQPLANPRRGFRDALALGLPGGGDRLQDHPKARHPMRRLRREVGSAVEGHAVRVAEGRERPPALAGHALDRLHVDRIDIRALLAVDLHADEALVHVARPSRRPRTTRAPSRGTSGRTSSRSTPGSGDRSSARARERSVPHGCQSTGLSLCWRR